MKKNNSILTRGDYEDFLVYLYFGGETDHILSCINRAYLDFNRTLHGFGSIPTRHEIHGRAKTELRRLFAEIQDGVVIFSDQSSFDQWHEMACQHLSSVYSNYGYDKFFIGQSQKWINMSFKYIFTLGEQRVSGFAELYSFCHVPIDNILMEKLAKYNFPQLSCAWSRLKDYSEYLTYQKLIREKFDYTPLDVEFLLWLGKSIN